ncbi:TPM domain-containing protein [Paenibacillus sonchi]|uniref:TPM domain-containing protein n=1 Tax=Paenibacillus sonchi TaxID=373687 RepID=UPI001E5F1C2F|nr:TPM domain-containing protein [Paenibacillus sonchi]MCE3200946.1 TPM domain-containing protein [Paenibacillus sonchi]
MKKTFKLALIAMLLSVLLLPSLSLAKPAVPKHTASFYVNDFADVIDTKTENYMVNYGVRLHQKDGAQVVLVTVDSTNGVSMEEYATALFNSWGVGSADKNNGVLLLMSIKDDDYWAVPGKGLESTLTDSKISKILSASLEPDFAKKDYSAGARKTYGALVQSLGGTYTETAGSKNYVADNAGVLPKVTKDYLNQSGNRYQPTARSGVYIVTVKNSGNQSLEDYTYAKFASAGAGPNDVMLVLDIGGDNYHALQGKNIDGILTNDVVSRILTTELEPQFAKKNYAAGATAAANAFYSFFLARADHVQETAAAAAKPGNPSATTGQAVKSASSPVKIEELKPMSVSKAFTIMGIFLIIILLISVAASLRNRHIALFGIPVNPRSPRNVRRYGTWYGQPGYGAGSRWYNRQHRRRRRPVPHHSGSSFWGSSPEDSSYTNHGGGGFSSGGGAGRYSSSTDDEDDNHGGGGSSYGGGAGRYSSDNDDNDSSSSGGGGSASSGGGVGRQH